MLGSKAFEGGTLDIRDPRILQAQSGTGQKVVLLQRDRSPHTGEGGPVDLLSLLLGGPATRLNRRLAL
jgi:hypothetical protein